jgi:hypothetical protein
LKRSRKPLPKVEVLSYGQYTTWDRESKELPQLLEMTEKVEARIDAEFGMIVEITGAKGRYLNYRIDHPPFADKNGNIAPPFEGSHQVRSTPFQFFLGDTIWAPVEDKRGEWKMSIFFEDQLVASKVLQIF